MRSSIAVFALLVLFSLVHSDFVTEFVIDDFEVPTGVLLDIIPVDGDLPVQQSVSTEIPSVLGGERDLIVVAESGPPGAAMSAEVSAGAWISSSVGQGGGFSSLQYDGLEGSNALNHDGLNCADLTADGQAGGFLIQAQATFATDFKFTVFGANGDVASAAKPVITNEQTYYYIPFDSFNGDVDFTCAGAIEITATIHPFSRFVVNTLVVGTYTDDPPSQTPTQSVTPTPTSTPSRVPSDGITGPTTATPTISPLPTVQHDCVSNEECAYLESTCVIATCVDYSCVVSENSADSMCCSHANDCEYIECKKASCNDENMCEYTPVACILSQSNSPADDPNNTDDGGNGWIAGVVLGSIGVVVLLGLVVLIIVIIVMKKRSANANSTSVYDAMIGDM